jgi:predicted nuclease with TOPRIM domain
MYSIKQLKQRQSEIEDMHEQISLNEPEHAYKQMILDDLEGEYYTIQDKINSIRFQNGALLVSVSFLVLILCLLACVRD